ncbi:biogenesis of lysosome-related organelles complex 1 subunit 4 isoform X3 [Macrobrachium rosenbergii]|uniref:biogenesis of lysosome-related organelles complex 1 subunit 4 isoform X3 n=1 Tax=Macrobrachium rosenbergii TaxID=79674 RepID=UPI0034D3A33F
MRSGICNLNLISLCTSPVMSANKEGSKVDEILKQTAAEYADYLQVDTSAERAGLDRELESMLTRLEEYGSLLERTRNISRHALDDQVPQVYSHYQALQSTFRGIDNLENLIKQVKDDLVKMEAAVSQAEADLNPSHGFTIRPLFFRREANLPPMHSSSPKTFEPPKIFRTDDYFVSSDSQPEPCSSVLNPLK